jgi:hypothetical protein
MTTMLKTWIGILSAIALLSGCAQMGPSPAENQSVRIEGTPGRAVVYIVRTYPDLSYLTTPVVVADRMVGATHAGTYIRVELPPGRHVISGYAQDNGAMTLDVQADRVYFVRQTVSGSWRATNPHSFFSVIDEARARAAMARASRIG